MQWQHICTREDLVAGSGVAALINGEQVALFYLPDQSPPLYAIGGANVLSRGIVGAANGELVVASPLYKQHFSLLTGACLEQDHVSVPVWEVKLDGDKVLLRPLPAALNRTGT